MNKYLSRNVSNSPDRQAAHCRAPRRSGAARGIMILVSLVAAVFGVSKYSSVMDKYWPSGEEAEDTKYVLHTAKKSPFRISITENGTIDSLKNSTLLNSVEGTTTIISLVPEGSRVNAPIPSEIEGTVEFVDVDSESEKTIRVRSEDGEEKLYTFTMGPFTEILVTDRQKIRKGDYIAGDMVCELDSSTLVEQEKQQQINVTTARADLEKAAKNLEIQESTNESLEAQARLAEKLAQLDLEKYTAEDGGEYQQLVETIQGDLKKIEEEQAMAQESYEQVRDQARRGYTNLNSLEAARIKVTQQKILLDVKNSELKLLNKFTKERTVSELQQKAIDSKRETKRVKLEGEAQMAGLKADYDARKLTLQVEEEKLERLLRQIKACRLIAPQQGEVVYASQSSRRSEPVVIEEGATVRERQAIINLPDLDQMKVDARIHESRISRIALGQPVEIYVDAVTSITYRGVLDTVSSVPSPGNWPNTDLKEYEAIIRITNSREEVRRLKPGMTAEVRIIVDDRKEEVLQVPVQSVMSLADRFYAYVAKGKNVERRELKVGDANDEYMEILDGIDVGEKVVMNPRTHFSREINELEVELLTAQEANRERVKVPAGPPAAAAGSGPGAKGGPTAGAGGGPPGGGGPPSPESIIERADTNKDGVLTKDETDLRGNFDKYDTDGDGKVTAQELKAAFSNR